VEFETDYLIESFRDHVIEPVDSEFIKMIMGFMLAAQQWRKEHGRSPSAREICKIVGVRKVTRAEEIFAHMLLDLEGFFKSKPPEELKQPVFNALRGGLGATRTDRFTDLKKWRVRRLPCPNCLMRSTT